MTDDPFLQLVRECVGLMHPAFARRGDRFAAAAEFYHQFRKLWDRGIPVGMGLGHVLLHAEPDAAFAVVRRPDGGLPDEPLAVLAFGPAATVERLATTKEMLGVRYAVAVLVRPPGDAAPAPDVPGVVVIDRFL